MKGINKMLKEINKELKKPNGNISGKTLVEFYNTTIFIEEAMHRLVEVYYKLGLIEESKKVANILGYNYLSSKWYKRSYKVFNKDYSSQVQRPIKKDKKGVLDKFKKLFD